MVLTTEDGTLAGIAVTEAHALTDVRSTGSRVETRPGAAAGFPLSTSPKMADDPVDVWLKPYERPNDTEAAMNAYLAWEVDLLERIEQDGTTQFLHGALHNR